MRPHSRPGFETERTDTVTSMSAAEPTRRDILYVATASVGALEALQPGQSIDDFNIIEVLGQGAFGPPKAVVRAVDQQPEAVRQAISEALDL